MALDVPSSSAGAPPPPADARAAIPAAPPGPRALDPVVVANPAPGTGATAYPADLPPISSLSMMPSQAPSAWKLDLPGWRRAREEFVVTTWEVAVETQDGQREPPLEMSFPCAITFSNPGGGWKERETIIALYAYRLRGGHWRIGCCVKGTSGVPEGQLSWLAALPVTRVWGWGARVEEHMSYAWLQMFTRAKQGHRKHLGEVGGGGRGCRGGGGRRRGTMPPPRGAPRSAGLGARWAGPARPPNSPPSRLASPRLQSPCRQRKWTLGWRRRRGPCPSGRSGRSRQSGRFCLCEASSRRQSSVRRRRSGGQRRWSETGTISGRRHANPSRRRAQG